jgi:hypothetical protein
MIQWKLWGGGRQKVEAKGLKGMVSSDQWAVASGEKKKKCKSERSERAWMLSQNHAEW